MTTPTKTMKAYVVREDHDGGSAIVFATNGATARRQGANELNMDFDEVDSCKREPDFDQFAPGPVPLSATLSNGWWHSCTSCSCTFDLEGRPNFSKAPRKTCTGAIGAKPMSSPSVGR
jgi:hypothetical protein